MNDLLEIAKWLLYGFIMGYFFTPVANILCRVCKEFKQACDEWSRPRG